MAKKKANKRQPDPVVPRPPEDGDPSSDAIPSELDAVLEPIQGERGALTHNSLHVPPTPVLDARIPLRDGPDYFDLDRGLCVIIDCCPAGAVRERAILLVAQKRSLSRNEANVYVASLPWRSAPVAINPVSNTK